MNKANEPYSSKGGKDRKEGFSYKKTFPKSYYNRVEKKYSTHNKNMKVIEMIWLWVVVRSSLIGLGNFSGISKLLSIDEPLNCSAVPSGERWVVLET